MSDRWLAYESSPVDWCEDNFTVSGNIAEFTNTISNILLIALPTIALRSKLWINYTRHISFGVNFMLYLFISVGISSAYFHATLSLFGQWLDEVGIIIAICCGYSFFTPNNIRPRFFKGIIAHVLSGLMAVTLTVTWFIAPYLNAFWMMALVFPMFGMMIRETKLEKNLTVVKLVKLDLFLFAIAMSLWVSDRMFCQVWLKMGIPGLHNIWHLLSAEVAYLSATIFAYWKAAYDKPFIKPSIRFYPEKLWGIPYVHCKDRLNS